MRTALDLHTVRRSEALAAAIAEVRRGASAVSAARYGEPNPAHAAILEDCERHLECILRELRALQ